MCAWITLAEMGKRDDRAPRQTREFDTGRLAALTKQPLPDQSGPAKTVAEAVEQDDAAGISLGRAATIDDPMTTGLLAEVARRSQTTEFDEETINEVLDQIDVGETNHPHTRRRTK
jgi:hypothetical protein